MYLRNVPGYPHKTRYPRAGCFSQKKLKSTNGRAKWKEADSGGFTERDKKKKEVAEHPKPSLPLHK